MDNYMIRSFIYKFTIFSCICGLSFSQTSRPFDDNLYGSFSFLIAKPQGDFSSHVTNNGYGIDIDGGYRFGRSPFAIGLNFAFATYGKLERKIPFSYFSDMVKLTETTESKIMMINPYLKTSLHLTTNVNIYIKAFGGYQFLNTSTTLKNDDQVEPDRGDDTDKPYIAKSDVFKDGAFNYGYGVGMRFPIPFISGKGKKPVISIECKWSSGGEAEYLNAGKEGSIVFSDPANGPVTTSYFPEKSKTDLFNISIGVGI
tara:strand:- start:103 stop:873 length:771 start_codon:yes stop_codon:yes gene_type:complete